MTDLTVMEKIADWQRLKALVLDSVSSPITRRVYNMALDEFIEWYRREQRPGFTKATVSAWRVSLEARILGSSSIIIRMSAIRKLAVEAADNGLLAPELAAGICRVKSVKSTGIRVGNWLSLHQAQALFSAPDIATVKGLRDRAILAVLLGCGLGDGKRGYVPGSTSDASKVTAAATEPRGTQQSCDHGLMRPSRLTTTLVGRPLRKFQTLSMESCRPASSASGVTPAE